MVRYIDDEAFKRKLIDEKNFFPAIVARALEEMPTADVVEVKHGEWIPVQYTYFGLKRYECSKCKDDEYWQKRYLEHKENYCPNCGAKMDGGGKSEH